MKTKENKKPDIKSMVLIAMFSALAAVGAFIRVPMGPVPFTLQLLFTNLAALLLGGKRGGAAVLIYILIGLLGIPVFTLGGGPGYVLQPTFGYLVGMALGAWLSGRIYEKSDGSFKSAFLAGLSNIALTYTIGTAYYAAIKVLYLGAEVQLWSLLVGCCFVFLPGDILSCTLGAVLAKRLRPLIMVNK